MILRGRPRRRPDHWSTPHERARVRAAERLSAPLGADEEAWLEAHLAACEPCLAIATTYRADQLAIRLMRENAPQPPRDLWARTAAAIERESPARRPAGTRVPRRPATSLPAVGAFSGIAVVALVVVATAISGDWFGGVGEVAVVPTATPALASPGDAPAPTALAVEAEEVHWLGDGENGAFAYNVTSVSVVCQKDRQPDCAPFADEDAKRVTLTATPRFIFQSPIDDQAVVVGTDASGADAVLVVSLPAPDPAPAETASANPDAPVGATDAPVPPPVETGTPGATDTPDPTGPTDAPDPTIATTTEPTPTEAPIATEPPIVTEAPIGTPEPLATEAPIGTDSPIVAPSEVPSASLAASDEPLPSESGGPEPSPTAIAIITNVVVVGRSASYSPDGVWFAFSARPSDGSAGPDIYIWHVGDLQARALTTDHASVFASWVGGAVLGSRLSGEPAALDPVESAAPGRAAGESPSTPPGAEASPSVSGSTSSGSASPEASQLIEPTPILEQMPQTFLVDPWTSVITPLVAAEWQPAVAPGGLVVVAWEGTVGIGPDGFTAAPVTGNLVVHPFRGPGEVGFVAGSPELSPAFSAGTSPGLTPGFSGETSPRLSPSPSASLLASQAASILPSLVPSFVASLSPSPSPLSAPDGSSSPLPQVVHDFPTQIVVAGPIADFDARWDDTGTWLAIWIADPLDPGLGRLSLLHFDPFTGLVDRPLGAPQDVTALPGFSIGFGRLAWASPPGQSGEGSRIQIAAWTASEVGAIESIPVKGAIIIQ